MKVEADEIRVIAVRRMTVGLVDVMEVGRTEGWFEVDDEDVRKVEVEGKVARVWVDWGRSVVKYEDEI